MIRRNQGCDMRQQQRNREYKGKISHGDLHTFLAHLFLLQFIVPILETLPVTI